MTGKARKKLWISAIPITLAGIALAVFFAVRPVDAAPIATAGAYEIYEVESRVGTDGIEISGNIEPLAAADLAFPIAGYIDAIHVSVGDYVTAGSVVAILEDKQQRYDVASVNVEIDTESVSGTQRNMDLLLLKREMMEASLEDTRLASTISGLVADIGFDVGDFVTAQAAGSSDEVVVRVIDRSSMTALVEVDELDAAYLAARQRVEFQFDSYPDLEVFGEVTSIPLEARKTSQGLAVLDTEVTILDPPREILPNFTFSGEILLGSEEQLLLLPKDAVVDRRGRTMVLALLPAAESADAGGTPGAPPGASGGPAGNAPGTLPFAADFEVPEGYALRPVAVSVADYGDDLVQILGGLAAGDKVLVAEGGVDAAPAEEEGGRSVMSLLGFPDRRPGGGPR